MAAIVITASNVIPAAGVSKTQKKVGEAVTAGTILYYNSANNDWRLASNAALESSGNGTDSNLVMALGAASANQYVAVATSSPGSAIAVGAVLTKGLPYVLLTSGQFGPIGDLGSGDFLTIVGYGSTTSNFIFQPISTGVDQ